MEFPKYVDVINDHSFTLARSFLLGVIIFFAWLMLHLSASVISQDTSESPRESCTVRSHTFTGTEINKPDVSPVVTAEAQCSFGKSTYVSSDPKILLRFATNPPTTLQCFEKKYKLSTYSGCDYPK